MKIEMPSKVKKIIDLLYFNGYEAYIVGGCVRDQILNKYPNDWDICTDCKPEKMLHLFRDFTVIPTGLKHGTVTIVMDGESYEITTYRIDGEYTDGRHPEEVKFTRNLREDLKRRDFTMNAMAYNERTGLIDYYGGVKDILNKVIRCVGDPFKRFSEDYLRMLRGVRFSAQLGYDLDGDIVKAMKELAKNIVDISAERIREELNKILVSDHPTEGIKLLQSTKLLKYIIPELEACVGFQQQNPHHYEDVFNHILTVVDNTENDLILRLSALFHDIGKPETFTLDQDGMGHFYDHNVKGYDITKRVMKRLRYDKKSIDQVSILVKEHMGIYNDASDKAIKRLINRVGRDNIDRLFKLQIADIKSAITGEDVHKIIGIKNRVDRILNEKEPLSIKDLKISGNDLISLGLAEGREIGVILNELMEIILEHPELNRKEDLIAMVENRLDNLSKL